MMWGGAEEQAQEHANGNPDVKNRQDEARQLLEDTVCYYNLSRFSLF